MADVAHEWTDAEIKKLEKRINAVYKQAVQEVEEKTTEYFKKFEIKDKKWRQWVKQGQKTEKEYQEWRIGQMAVGDRWEALKDTLSQDYHNANSIAKNIAYETAKDVYAENHNFGTYEIEHGLGINTSYTLYNKSTIESILRDNPDLLPEPGKKVSSLIAAGLENRWNKQIIQSAVLQGILQGESIPKLATRLALSVGDKNRKSAIRNARTMMTGAQNAGRVDSYKRAQNMGINIKQQWVATFDGRTRHEHRLLDGQCVEVGQPFKVEGMEIRFPGDPTAPARLVYNCRCTLISQLKGFEIDATKYRQDPDFKGMSYSEWKTAKAKSNKITAQEEKAAKIKQSYDNKYKNGGKR